jgi:hypothetical protein
MALQQVIIMPTIFVETNANCFFFIPSIGNGVVGRQETNLAE